MRIVPVRRVAILFATLFLLSLLPYSAMAQEQGSSQKADIIIYVIEASNEGQGVDPQIQGLVKELGAFRYSSYKLVSKIPRQLRSGEKESVSLPGNRQMQLQMQGAEGNRVKLKVKITEKSEEQRSRDILNTEFRIIEGGTIMIGGYDYRNGKLFVAISAK